MQHRHNSFTSLEPILSFDYAAALPTTLSLPLLRALISHALVVSVTLCASVGLRAQEEATPQASKTRWSGEVGLGGEYDTNVSVNEVDLSSGESDYARVIDF